jgi:hypothetical protein
MPCSSRPRVLKIPMREAALKLQSQFLNGTNLQDFSAQEKLAKVEQKLQYEHDAVQRLGLSPERRGSSAVERSRIPTPLFNDIFQHHARLEKILPCSRARNRNLR